MNTGLIEISRSIYRISLNPAYLKAFLLGLRISAVFNGL